MLQHDCIDHASGRAAEPGQSRIFDRRSGKESGEPMSVLVGNVVKIKATFRDEENTKQDPSTVQVRIKKPDTSIVSYVYGTNRELVRASQGVYDVLVDTTGWVGTFQFVWNSSGNYKAAGQTQLTVVDDYF